MPTTVESRSARRRQSKTEQEPLAATEEPFVAGVRELDEEWTTLDEHGGEPDEGPETEGIRPSGLMLSHCRLTFAVAFGCAPKRAATERTRLSIAPRAGDAGRLRFSFRYHPMLRGKE